jgi:hypothetical protein
LSSGQEKVMNWSFLIGQVSFGQPGNDDETTQVILLRNDFLWLFHPTGPGPDHPANDGVVELPFRFQGERHPDNFFRLKCLLRKKE